MSPAGYIALKTAQVDAEVLAGARITSNKGMHPTRKDQADAVVVLI